MSGGSVRETFFLLLVGLLLAGLAVGLLREEGGSRRLEPIGPQPCIIEGQVVKGSSLYYSLLKAGLGLRQVQRIVDSLRGKVDLKRSRPGDSYKLRLLEDGSVLDFIYQNGDCAYILEGDSLQVTAVSYEDVVRGMEGTIEGSLWESMRPRCKDAELIMKFSDIFRWDIDFFTEPRNGDRYRLLYIERRQGGRFVSYGDILCAQYISRSKVHTAILYEDSSGHRDYYDPQGKSLRKTFLRAPLNYRRISSGFSYHRLHPIYKIYRPHLGIDYAAPQGTPIVASGDGVISFAGWNNGFGKFIKIDHGRGYVTTYGHLSRFARGIKRGKRVKQGEVIGYVGQTGVATGPHLDYRFILNHRYVNPLRIRLPAAKPLSRRYWKDFLARKDALLKALDQLSGEWVAGEGIQEGAAQ